jgi:pilus assembly protein CpaE
MAVDLVSSCADVELVAHTTDRTALPQLLESTGVDVVVLDATAGLDPQLVAVAREHETVPVVALVADASPHLIDQACRLSVADVAPIHTSPEHLSYVLRKTAVFRAATHSTRTRRTAKAMTFLSTKGGVGKTTIACNVGATLAAHCGLRTLLVDADFASGDVALTLGEDVRHTVTDLLMTNGPLDGETIERFATKHVSGMHVLAAPTRIEDAALLEAERFAHMLAAARDSYDMVLIDTPSDLNEHVIAALDHTDEAVLVSSLDVAALKNLVMLSNTLGALNIAAHRRIVVNRSGADVLLKDAQVRDYLPEAVFTKIPSSKLVPTSLNIGALVTEAHPRSPVSQSLIDLAMRISPLAAQHQRSGLRGMFRRSTPTFTDRTSYVFTG